MNIEDDTLKAVVAKAIFDSIPAETRNKMLTDAVVALVTPPTKTDYYGKQPQSKLADIFKNEVYAYARTAVRERMATDPQVQEAVKGLCAKAFAKLMQDESVIDSMAGLISKALARANEVR